MRAMQYPNVDWSEMVMSAGNASLSSSRPQHSQQQAPSYQCAFLVSPGAIAVGYCMSVVFIAV